MLLRWILLFLLSIAVHALYYELLTKFLSGLYRGFGLFFFFFSPCLLVLIEDAVWIDQFLGCGSREIRGIILRGWTRSALSWLECAEHFFGGGLGAGSGCLLRSRLLGLIYRFVKRPLRLYRRFYRGGVRTTLRVIIIKKSSTPRC